MELNGQILSQLNIPVHIPLTELRWFYIQEKLNSFQKFISMFVASNLMPRTFEILLSVSSLHNIIAGDLWGERGILGEVRNECGARDEGRRKIKRLLPVHCSESPTFTAWTLRSGWFNCWARCFGIFVWPVSWDKITVTLRIHVLLTMLFEKPSVYFQMFQKQKKNKTNV